MSIIRLSVMERSICAPDAEGNVDPRDFTFARNRPCGQGSMPVYPRGILPTASDDLTRFLERAVEREAARLPAKAPVVVMVHGWGFDPLAVAMPEHRAESDNPHSRIYHFDDTQPPHLEEREHSTPWPLRLGFAEGDEGAGGLVVAFAWKSSFPSFFGISDYRRSYDFAAEAAWQLVCVLQILARKLKREIDIFCHSLGTRVAIEAVMQAIAPQRRGLGAVSEVLELLGRVLLLAGAERSENAQSMLAALGAWRRPFGEAVSVPDFFCFPSRSDLVVQRAATDVNPGPRGFPFVIGRYGLLSANPLWTDIQLDSPSVVRWFAERPRGYALSGDGPSALDHWVHFTHPGNMALYADVLRKRKDWEVAKLKSKAPEIFDRVPLFVDDELARSGLFDTTELRLELPDTGRRRASPSAR